MTTTAKLDRLSDFRTRITRIVREATGMHERLALPIAEAICCELQDRYGGAELYVPAKPRETLHGEILDAWRSGATVADLCRRYPVSRRTIYRVVGGASDTLSSRTG